MGKPAKKTADGAAPTPGNIDQIREIIFGSQIRDYDKRFVELENQIARAAGELGKQLEARARSLENSLARQDKSLRKELTDSSKQGASGLAATEGRLKKALDGLQAGLAELDEWADRETQDLRKELGDQGTELRALVDTVESELREHTDKRLRELDQSAVHRQDMAALLRKLADKLDGG